METIQSGNQTNFFKSFCSLSVHTTLNLFLHEIATGVICIFALGLEYASLAKTKTFFFKYGQRVKDVIILNIHNTRRFMSIQKPYSKTEDKYTQKETAKSKDSGTTRNKALEF